MSALARSDRLFEIIQVVRSSKHAITAQKLAHMLEVTVRTVYRDIAALQHMHIPIEGSAGLGYAMRAGFNLPPLMFSLEEVEAMVVGLALIQRTGDDGLQEAAQAVKRKLANVIPKELLRSLNQSTLQVSNYGIKSPPSTTITKLRHVIRACKKLRLNYANTEGVATQRTVLPLAITYYVEVAVLAAWCELRQDFRHFRVDRITQCQELEAYFLDQSEHLHSMWLAQIPKATAA